MIGSRTSPVTGLLFRPMPGLLLALAGCGPPPPESLPPTQIAFGVFGDGPYDLGENGRFDRVLEDVEAADVKWLIHVGDLFASRCSDEKYRLRLDQFNRVPFPVVYTPGDNEWTDCHSGHDPLERLQTIRRLYFAQPRSLGRRQLTLETQAADQAYREFVENTRWRYGGFVFATVHMVGSHNGMRPFRERQPQHDREVERRTQAAIEWLNQTFAMATQDSAKGVVIALHGNPWNTRTLEPWIGYDRFIHALRHEVAAFRRPVLVINGDTHQQKVDHPLTDSTGTALHNFTRLETFGSPKIGWVRVVIDTAAGKFVAYQPRLMRGWW